MPLAIERHIAVGRILVSIAALVSVWIDPTTPSSSRLVRVTGGLFVMDSQAFAVLFAHVSYALACLGLDVARPDRRDRRVRWTLGMDVLFGVAVSVVTEGWTSPAYVFFAFAILAAGARAEVGVVVGVTLASVALYLAIIVVSAASGAELLMMRPVYLAITGVLVAYLARRRHDCERQAHEAEARAERLIIARTLHDGYVQALAAVNIRLENCRTLLGRDRTDDVRAELAALQQGVRQEYDEVRAYVRSLAALEPRATDARCGREPRCAIRMDLAESSAVAEHVLLIALEGIRNVRRHADATETRVVAEHVDGAIRVTIGDDGIGFADADGVPWSIASRVRACHGAVRVADDVPRGGALIVELPCA